MTPDQYCQEKAAKSGSSFYYSFLFLPEKQRKAIMALYAFCREVDDIVDETTNSQIARIKLQWWRETLSRMAVEVPQHPVQKALQQAMSQYNLPLEYFIEIIDGMEMDLDQSRYPTFTDLSLYCYRVAGVVGLLAAEIFGYQDRATQKYAYNLGMAFQLTNIIRDVGEDAARGRIYIPLDEIAAAGLTPEAILRQQDSPEFRALMMQQAQRAEAFYRKAMEHLPDGDRHTQRSGLIMAAIYQTNLQRIAAKNYDVLHQRISLAPLHKLWIAWRTYRLEQRRHRCARPAVD